jgi:hypothetical protein
VRPQPGQERVQRLQGAAAEHVMAPEHEIRVMPPALVSDTALPLLHSRASHEHADLLPSMIAVIVVPHSPHLYVST